MSLFDLQDVCIAIGSLATLDLPMVVDLIGIYMMKGPYCTLTTTKWFLQALSVIPRGSCLKCRFSRETGRSQAPRRQQVEERSAGVRRPAGELTMMKSAVSSAISRKLQHKPAVGTGKTSSNDSAATQLQHLAFSDADFVFATEILDAKQGSLYRKRHHGNSKRFLTRTKADFVHRILSQGPVQATSQQVRDLRRIRSIEILPDFVQEAGFVNQTSGFAQFT
ncbi:hypothetical protein F511_11905 [Dorcoceras hygrometricum]|uniref:Uncharacterized protein n=1 Tax=Dorcoceras hygrometricum TaxID=472368 RepID=A0A2Z7DK37_9LAMI|nr:hypothetical protein F511_11905 [Dorcoceras hygrometricum]